jgi:hypothetical protein
MTDPTDHPDPKEATEAKLCAYLEGELAPADRAEIERHLAANPQHKQLLVELAKTRQWMQAIPRIPAPSDLAEAFQGQVERNMLLDTTPVTTAPRRWSQWWLAAAMIFLVLGLGAVVTLILLPNGKGSGVIVDKGYPGPAADKTAGSSTQPGASPAAVVAPAATAPPAGPAAAGVPAPTPASPPSAEMGAMAEKAAKDESTPKPAGGGGGGVNGGNGGGRELDERAAADAKSRQVAPDAAKQSDVPAWTPPATGLNVPAGDHTIYVVVRTADPVATSAKALAFFDAGHLAIDPIEPVGGPALAMRNAAADQAGGRAGFATNAAAPSDLELRRQQQNLQQSQAGVTIRGGPVSTQTGPQAPPTTAPTADVATIAAHGLTHGQVERLAFALAEPNAPGDVRIMRPDQGKYVDELTVTPITRGRSLLVVVPQLDKPGVDKANVVKVADDGTVTLPMIDPVEAAGASTADLSKRIAEQYREENIIPAAQVQVKLLPAEVATDMLTKASPTTMPLAAAQATTGPVAEAADYTAVVVTEPPAK